MIVIFNNSFLLYPESSIALLVNNVVQKPRKNLQNIQTIIYNYGENDAVDVSCVCLNRKCDLQMNYDYATMLDGQLQLFWFIITFFFQYCPRPRNEYS